MFNIMLDIYLFRSTKTVHYLSFPKHRDYWTTQIKIVNSCFYAVTNAYLIGIVIQRYYSSGSLHILCVLFPILHSIPENLEVNIRFCTQPPALSFFSSPSTAPFKEVLISPNAQTKEICGRGSYMTK